MLASVVLVLLPLTGCGDPIKSYCSDLQGHRKELAAMTETASPTGLINHLQMLQDLAKHAPSDLTDEWQTLINAVVDLKKAVADSGHKPSDFDDDTMPGDISETKKKAIRDAATRLGSDDVVRAGQGIEQQARDVCKVNIGI